jgi:methylthioribose-1-phosphate isomerase
VSDIVWWESGAIGYVDQRRLPHELVHARAERVEDVVAAIGSLAVRGAPCIGVFAAYGLVIARDEHPSEDAFRAAVARIRAARPTAVNLAWAIDRVLATAGGDYLAAAREIHEEQKAVDRAIARAGAELLPEHGAVITHCNTGPLATGGEGTALAMIVEAHRAGKRLRAYVDETRPLLQGARLTMVELARAGVPATLIVDGAAPATIGRMGIGCAIVGADRIAANGDTANKIGTLALALAAQHHRIPFYVAAPRSTIDFALASGEEIPIEERSAEEVRAFAGVATAPHESAVYNPAFDLTPARLITGIVTEYGVSRPPYGESLADLATRPRLAFAYARA